MNLPMRKDHTEELTTADFAQSKRVAKEDGQKPVLAERRISAPEQIATPHHCFPITNWRVYGMIGAPFRLPSSMSPAVPSSKLIHWLHQR